MKKSILILSFVFFVFTACEQFGIKPKVRETFKVTIENVSEAKDFLSSGVFNMPVGATMPGAIGPGDRYEFTINAGKNQKLSFATMLAATNDLFFAPGENGISLYDDNGEPISAEITDQIYLWDAGTEVNEEPAVGPNTVTNQPAPNTGPAENGVVQLISAVNDGYTYPAVEDVIHVTVAHVSGIEFMVTIENVSNSMTLQTSEGGKPAPASPGVWVVHQGSAPLFTAGEPDRGEGVEAIAEDGNPTDLGDFAVANTGLTYPVSPGAWAIHDNDITPIFTEDAADAGEGLEGIAEDGDPTMLGASLSANTMLKASGVFNMPVSSSDPGPLLPGQQYKFTFTASKGDLLSFATMLAATNDLFFAPGENGISLYDDNGEPISAEITDQIYLWDAGTEVNEAPFYGPNTVTNQSAPNTGPDENGVVQEISNVNDEYMYPTVGAVIKVTIKANDE